MPFIPVQSTGHSGNPRKLSDSETEAAETQVWLEFSFRCGYIRAETFKNLDQRYEHILSQLVTMIMDAHS